MALASCALSPSLLTNKEGMRLPREEKGVGTPRRRVRVGTRSVWNTLEGAKI